ncbi:MAG: hypothetical protein ACTSPV_09005 [Candidatus Hodarchaeales archaeon]
MRRPRKSVCIASGLYLSSIIISLLWFEPLMLLVFLITVLGIYINLGQYLALRQRHYSKDEEGNEEEFFDSQKWDEFVVKTSMRRSKGVL